ncbi:heavy metal translocating P-type ATPase [Pontibaca methylaminivorans]|uniref:P-type Zn(2+) transporter n=1 Tax=Pontibaca methylaminivorans TaxID=515897 RepID=A0A1R3WR48_9RHOB|nr:heavy metal translocating P-type ATPase [Pontibaca methylaminivorans]SIT80737.1 Cd2+/Zn2+-exporting ATPase [Pontibaca methylaminivorans]
MREQAGTTIEWRIGGMDCGSCAAKVRGAVERLPGAGMVEVTLMSERLRVDLDATRTPPAVVEDAVRALGYTISQPVEPGASGPDGSPGADAAQPSARWYSGAKGRLVIGTGLLLAGATLARFLLPWDIAYWGFVLATLAGIIPVARRAFAMLRAGMPFTIEMLMSIAAVGALVIGAPEEAAVVVFLFAVGELLEGVAADRARHGIRALGRLVPRSALLKDGDALREIPAADLRIGQQVLVRPGARVPADGVVVEGISGVDESPVTGESIPSTKQPGAAIFAGSVNTEAVLVVEVTKAPADNTIARIIRLVEEAESARAPTERFIDRFSRIYMPAVVGFALLVALVPTLGFGQDWGTWIYRALALLLIGCPCALVISVPASIASALTAGTRSGLLLKGGAVIEAAARTRRVAFDKTGTLTMGRPEVSDVVALAGEESDLLALAAAVEQGSSHPLGLAIIARTEADGVAIPPASDARAIPGMGAVAVVHGAEITVGSPRHAAEIGAAGPDIDARVEALEAEGKTVVVVLREGRALGLVALRDGLRGDAAAGVSRLADMGIRSVMLTGDNARAAGSMAGMLGIDHRAGLLPEDKVAAIREMAARDPVMMVGDGINDAPALAAAHLGVAMGSGTDVALEVADAAVLRNRVGDVAAMIALARAAMRNIRQNVAIALGLKGIFLVTTVFGFTGLWLAVLADTGATVLVTANALRLLLFRPDRDEPPRKARPPQAPLSVCAKTG